LAAGRVIHGTLKRNGLTNVGGVLLHALHLLVPCYGAVDREI